MTLEYTALFILILLSGLFSGTETAYTSLSYMQMNELESSRHKRERLAAKLAKRPDQLLTTILIGNNLVNIAASALTTTMVIRLFGSYAVGYATGALTLVILIFAEITPKQIAIIHSEWIAGSMAYPIYWLSILLKPVIWLINTISRSITLLFAGKQKKKISLRGILHVMHLAENQGVVEDYETQLVRNVFRFDNIDVHTIMTHRTDIFSIEESRTLEDVLPEIVRNGYSRIPVYKKDPENITGVLIARDLFSMVFDDEGKEKKQVREIMKEPIFVSETKRVHRMFFLFKREKLHLAIVLDEYGGLAGIVTLEDVMEVLLGELYDEHETGALERISKFRDGMYVIQGETPIQQFQDTFDVMLSHSSHVRTIGGYLIEFLGQIPVAQQKIDTPAGKFVVTEMTGNRIEAVSFKPRKLRKAAGK